MTFEETLRKIIREELVIVLEHLDTPKPVKTHVGSTELMAALGISRGTVHRMMREGCPYVSPGRNPRFVLEDVKRYLETKGASDGAK